MTRDTKRLAKLTRPRVRGIATRQRLFELIDRLREQPVIWVTGPPGSGKTSLAASYLESRALPAHWYDVDGGDADPATFFYFLRQSAGGSAARNPDPLPLLTPEYLHDLPGFSRRFFRNLYARLAAPSFLVFDNYHEVPAESPVHVVIEQALSQVPDGLNVIVLSRAEPPAQCARLVANGRISRIGFPELRLTFEETAAVAQDRLALNDESLRALHAQADGWAAGTILMLERLTRTGALNFVSQAETMDTVFNYFAGQIFDDLPEMAREVLVHTSVLPRVSADMAVALSGNGRAGQVLEQLYRQHLFIERRVGDVVTYHMHTLFRAFLLAQAAQRHGADSLAQLRRRAAQLLEANGDVEDAVLTYQQAQDWPAATALILEQTHVLHARGRLQTLKRWISAMPAHVIDDAPRLLCSLGYCDVVVDPPNARRFFERAFETMKDRNDALGQVMAAAGIVETLYLDWADFRPLDRWIAELERLLAEDLEFPTREAELRAYCGMLMATLSRQPGHALLEHCATRVMRLLTEGVETNLAVVAGAFLLHYYSRFDVRASAPIVAFVRPLLNRSDLAPISHLVWLGRYARYCSFLLANFDESDASFDQALAVMEKTGLHNYAVVLRGEQLLVSMAAMDAGTARSLVARLEPAIDPARRIETVLLHLAKSRIALRADNLAQAVRHAQSALEVALTAGATAIGSVCLLFLAEAASEQRDAAGVRGYLAGIRASFPLRAAPFIDHLEQIHEGKLAAQQGKLDEACRLVRLAIETAMCEGFLNMNWCPRLAVWLCAFALENEIEVDYVRMRIKACGLLPPAPDVEHWPWPVRIYTLSRFAVVIDGTPLVFSGKAQKRPLEVLKALIALGGRDVGFIALLGAVWPGGAGDAQKSFEMALSRLRKLLGRGDAIQIQEGKVTLNPQLVWVDIWAFERLVPRADEEIARDDGAADATAPEPRNRAQRALELYKGRFFEREPHAPWMQSTADRLQAKFLRLVLALGRSREGSSWEDAARIYARGLESDNLAEELYRRLMICYRAQGRVAEAMNVYRRCRENLSIILGIAPSAETVDLYESLRNG